MGTHIVLRRTVALVFIAYRLKLWMLAMKQKDWIDTKIYEFELTWIYAALIL